MTKDLNKLSVTARVTVLSNISGVLGLNYCSILTIGRPITGFWCKFHNKTYLISEELGHALVNEFVLSIESCYSLVSLVSSNFEEKKINKMFNLRNLWNSF